MFVGYADPEWVWPQAVTLYTKNFDVIGFYRSHEENPLQHGMKVLCPPMGGELQSHVLWAWILYLCSFIVADRFDGFGIYHNLFPPFNPLALAMQSPLYS